MMAFLAFALDALDLDSRLERHGGVVLSGEARIGNLGRGAEVFGVLKQAMLCTEEAHLKAGHGGVWEDFEACPQAAPWTRVDASLHLDLKAAPMQVSEDVGQGRFGGAQVDIAGKRLVEKR